MDVPPLPARRAMVGPLTTTRSHLLWVLKGGLARPDLDNRLVILSCVQLHRPATERAGVQLRMNANDFTNTHVNWIRRLSRLKLIIRPRRAVATRALVCRSCKAEETACHSFGPVS